MGKIPCCWGGAFKKSWHIFPNKFSPRIVCVFGKQMPSWLGAISWVLWTSASFAEKKKNPPKTPRNWGIFSSEEGLLKLAPLWKRVTLYLSRDSCATRFACGGDKEPPPSLHRCSSELIQPEIWDPDSSPLLSSASFNLPLLRWF